MPLSPDILYKHLLTSFGHQDWWPIDKIYHTKNNSDPRFEIMIGAILTQNTAWINVEKALENLKRRRCLTIQSIVDSDTNHLKKLIQPSGFFNQKAHRLKLFSAYLLTQYHSDLDTFFNRDTQRIREELLSLHGIGPETADSILLYAGNHPVFVVDAYTKRISKRIPLPSGETYHDIQQYFEQKLRKTNTEKQLIPVYKELHALIVEQAKQICKPKPDCIHCSLQKKLYLPNITEVNLPP